ncbi:deleted in malignant brain tumors 1 protein isoform X2 [Nematostella vectensis]|uniref:deleted in malignant brain tumors 1 protein isoform X2 n=1 Tax=Nematostella vectensis TaxID=45351 RepID=UPI0020773110|nr:deleted in malignant brain tumors 1 protein isoform X2 [Nematostella vectensis]
MASRTNLLAAAVLSLSMLLTASGSHFRGGIISWTANDTSPYVVNFYHRTVWRRSDTFCNSYNVRANSVYHKSGHTFQGRHPYYGTYTMYDSQYYRCLDYSESEDWSEIGNNFTYAFPHYYWYYNQINNWDISFADCCWIHLHGSIYSEGSWRLSANVSLSPRADTGRINSSPFSSIPLTVNVTSGIRQVIVIPVEDPDGDNVSCLWASEQPSFPYGELDEAGCTLTYNGGGTNGTMYPVFLVLEDGICNTSLQFVIKIKQLREEGIYSFPILAGNVNYMIDIQSFLRPVQHSPTSGWSNCWTASRDGWEAEIFHHMCDNRGPTVTLVRVGNYIFGGYSNISWTGSHTYKSSSKDFLFTIFNTNGYRPEKLPLRSSNYMSIFDTASYGPTFGAGHDLYISNMANTNSGGSFTYSLSYKLPTGCSSSRCGVLAGSYYFTPSEVEVYYEILVNNTSVKCSDGHMEVWMSKAVYPGVTAESLQLLSPSCKAQDTGPFFYFKTSFHGCGTKHNQTADHITYWNKAFSPLTPLGKSGSVITRYASLSVPFYCKFSRHGDVSLSYTIKKSVPVWHGSYGNFTFTLDLFYSDAYQRPRGLADYPVPAVMDEPLHIQYSVKSTTGNLSVLADSCRATLTKEPYSSPFYTFIEKGCAKDNTMSYVYKQDSTQRFTINSFLFVHQHPDQVVYLHCRLIVCHRLSYDSRCHQGCYGRRRREVNAEDEEAEDLYLTLKASNRQGGAGNQKVSNFSTATSAGLGTLGVLVVVFLAVIGVFMMRRRIVKKSEIKLDTVASATNQVVTIDDESLQEHAQSTA